MTLKKFKALLEETQDYYIEESLPIFNHVNNHMLSMEEVYIMLEVITPIIEQKCLLGDDLKKYLTNKLNEKEI